MESKTGIIVFSVVLVVVGLFVLGYSGEQGTTASVQGVTATTASASSLTASETSYDFGTISMKNGNVMKEFTVTNPTDKDITARTILTSSMCTTAFIVRSEEHTSELQS